MVVESNGKRTEVRPPISRMETQKVRCRMAVESNGKQDGKGRKCSESRKAIVEW